MSGYHAFVVLGTPGPGKVPVMQPDGTVMWDTPSGGPDLRAKSILAGLPYAIPAAFDINNPALEIAFAEPAAIGDTYVCEAVVQVENDNLAADANVGLEIGLDLAAIQDSAEMIVPFGAANVGNIQTFAMSIAWIILAPSATPTFGLCLRANQNDVVAPQVFFQVTKQAAPTP